MGQPGEQGAHRCHAGREARLSIILAPSIHGELEGRSAGEVIEVPVDGNRIFGPRDESLVFTDLVENVPVEHRQVGTSIEEEMIAGGAIVAGADVDPSLLRTV